MHHILLYTCDGSGVDSFTNEQLSGVECFTGAANWQDPKLGCLRGNLVAAWAVGGTVSAWNYIVIYSVAIAFAIILEARYI